MIDFAMTIPIDDVEIHQFPLEIISEILQQVTFDEQIVYYIFELLFICLATV